MIVGQDELVKNITRIFEIFNASEGEIRPNFILTGGSGTGKTFIINQLANKFNMGFCEINAAQLTKEGTSGNSLSKALSPLMNMTNKLNIVFVDEYDKLFISGNTNDTAAHDTTVGVQNEFLKVIESETTQVYGDYGKYISVPTKNTLFIFAGAFNNEENITLDRLREIGIKNEFLGRVGLIYNTNNLTLDNMYTIIDNSVLLDNYCKLFNKDYDTVADIIKNAINKYHEKNSLGARMINTLIQQYFITGNIVFTNDNKDTEFKEKLTF